MYQEWTAPAELSALVECFWAHRDDGTPGVRRHRVLPDNCTDIIFDLGDLDGQVGPVAGLRSYVVGTMRSAIVVGRAGPADLLGVRFRPGVAASLTGLPAYELTDATAPPEGLFPGAATLVEWLGEASPASRVAMLSEAVLRWAREARRRPDTRVQRAVALIGASGGRAAIGTVAERAGVSTRQLERGFRDEVGISPKEAARVARLQRAVACIDPGGRSLAAAAYHAGYHDQSHMTREFRSLAGVTPAAYAAERRVGFVQDHEGERS